MNDRNDPLHDLLRPNLPPSPPWKDALLARTTRTVRWRRRGRRFVLVAALAACYVAGVLTMRLMRPEPTVEYITEYVYVTPKPKIETPTETEPPLTALALEWQAVENPERSVELYRRAGDRYVDEENDLESALRCYKRFLSACSETDLEITTRDNWLLVTLKNARLEEKRYAKNHS